MIMMMMMVVILINQLVCTEGWCGEGSCQWGGHWKRSGQVRDNAVVAEGLRDDWGGNCDWCWSGNGNWCWGIGWCNWSGQWEGRWGGDWCWCVGRSSNWDRKWRRGGHCNWSWGGNGNWSGCVWRRNHCGCLVRRRRSQLGGWLKRGSFNLPTTALLIKVAAGSFGSTPGSLVCF